MRYVFLILLSVNLYSQNDNALKFSLKDKNLQSPLNKKEKEYKIKPVRMVILGTAGAGVFTAMHIYYSNTWWKDQRKYFKFAEDGYYARNMDKASHIYTANFFTEASAVAYEWAGMHPKTALIWGAVTSMAYETYIEVNDGFAPNWGVDWLDMGANIFGALYPFMQRGFEPLQNVNFKWSFKPDWLKKKSSGGDDLLDDYTNMTFWLSVNPEIILPRSVTKGKFYPNFLSLALGMSVKNSSHKSGSTKAYTEWFLSLDWDIRKLPGKSDFMKKLKKILNFYHFPAPAVRISPSGIWYGLYF
ncbi:MAG: YfiM family protein [Ignavibacteria bacterium]|nr:YfiM family protein [Ignavibacteria bacterium]